MSSRIVAISGPLKGQTFQLGRFDLVIGKGRSCQVRLNDPLVSTRHCGICHWGKHPALWDIQSGTGTFVNGFHFHGKVLLDGDRIRVGTSIFVYLDQNHAEVDSAILTLTPVEEEWDRKLSSGDGAVRAAAYEAAMGMVLDAFLDFNGRINAVRDADEIQSRVFDLIFRVLPMESAAILIRASDGDDALTATYRRIGSQSDEPFPLNDAVTEQVLREGKPVYAQTTVCWPLSTPDTKVGLLYAVLEARSIEYFTVGHDRLLRAIAGSTAVALVHARYVAWLEGENRRLNEAINLEHGMIGRSDNMQHLYQLVDRAGPSELMVLITGESGTGKELVAKALHRNSPRSQNAMYVVNCAAFTGTLLISELFGHERGAFTGADKQRKGLFEHADGGTVFLDEIGECSLQLQADLLRLIQQGEFKRLGSNQVLHANVRIVAATNVDLEQAIKEGRFRQDLYFRLNKIRIHMPRLAERREDIPLLIDAFIKKHGHIRPGAYPRVKGIKPELRRLFASYDWPGNVRELENLVERAIALGTSAYIGREDLPAAFGSTKMQAAEIGQWTTELNAAKKAIIERALLITGGKRAEAARLLDLNLKYFSSLCKETEREAAKTDKTRKSRKAAASRR
jgi:DNA-binding NtrC family response regulator/pSer/pThr/pTyr-binding forkhead associated (FHA) protein